VSRAARHRLAVAAVVELVGAACSMVDLAAVAAQTTTTIPAAAGTPTTVPAATGSTTSTSGPTAPTTTTSTPTAPADTALPTTGVPLLIGAGTPVTPAPVTVSATDQLAAAAPGAGGDLTAAVAGYFDRGGKTAQVLVVSSLDPSAIAAALPTRVPGMDADVLVVPSLVQTDGATYLQLAAALAAAAQRTDSIALLDPPDSLVAQATAEPDQAVALLSQLTAQLKTATPDADHAVLYGSGLVDPATGATVQGSVVGAAIIAASDARTGPWTTPGGASAPVAGRPTVPVDEGGAAALQTAGVTSLRTVPGYGTIAWGTRTIAAPADLTNRGIGAQRVLLMLHQNLREMLVSFEMQRNWPSTWAAISASTTRLLQELWDEGALVGSSRRTSASVQIGAGTTMTEQDLEDSVVVLVVRVALTTPGQFTTITMNQQMVLPALHADGSPWFPLLPAGEMSQS
jgi:hypothetical protein